MALISEIEWALEPPPLTVGRPLPSSEDQSRTFKRLHLRASDGSGVSTSFPQEACDAPVRASPSASIGCCTGVLSWSKQNKGDRVT